MEIEIIKAALAENKKISGWKIVRSEKQGNQIFGVHEKIETARVVDSETTAITVYVDHDEKTGNSTFSLYASDDYDELKEKAEKAAERALLIFDEKYPLPEKSTTTADVGERSSKERFADAEKAYFAVQKAVEKMKGEGCAVNAVEIFVTDSFTTVENSNGLKKQSFGTEIMIEAIPTCNGKEQSVELYEALHYETADENRIESDVETALKDVKARLEAQKPEHSVSCPIIFRAQEINELFDNILSDADYATVYSHGNLHSVGDDIRKQAAAGDITVTLKGEIPGCTASRKFDGDGVDYCDVTVIKNGILENNYGGSRFAYYLGGKPTGANPCTEIAAGKLSEKEILSGNRLEIASMSGLQVDLYNDYIGGEVRLAYLTENGKTTPVTGISISGSLSEVLGSFEFSSERVTRATYYGPKYAKADKLTIY